MVFFALFEQILSLDELHFVIDAFERLEEDELAVEFRLVLDAVTHAGYELTTEGYPIERPLFDQLEAIGERIRDLGRLWRIDEKLVKLLPPEK